MYLAVINNLLGMTERASDHAPLIDNMLEFCHWFMLALFVGWSCFFLFMLVRFHKSRQPKADYQGLRSHASSHVEFTVVLVEAIILLGFAIPLWGKRVLDMPAEDDATVVRVVGQQYFWNFHYPGPDGIFGRQKMELVSSANQLGLDWQGDPAAADDIVTANEFHVPVKKPVLMQISSKDVIHNVSLPHMRVSQDANPGMVVPVAFSPTKEGSFELVCGQLCGGGHALMRGILVVDSEEAYAEWFKEMESLRGPVQASPAAAAASSGAAAES